MSLGGYWKVVDEKSRSSAGLMSEALQPTNALNLGYLESLYEQFLEDPASVPEDVQQYFGSLAGNGDSRSFRSGPSFSAPGLFRSGSAAVGISGDGLILALQHKVDLLIRNFRVRGHRHARVNPLSEALPDIPEIDPAFYQGDRGNLIGICKLIETDVAKAGIIYVR